jgi:hypothetical protein
MSHHSKPLDAMLGTLAPPRLNHFFYGQQMDVPQFVMLRDYARLKQWLLNRLALGKGVLCGLDVTIDHDKLCVNPGVAIDGLGREIIVPVRACVDPFAPPEHGCCGEHEHPADREGRRFMTLWVCYRECLTDYAPVLVSDCDVRERCLPGTILETFCLKLTDGQPPPLGDPEWCPKLWDPHEPSASHPDAGPAAPPAGEAARSRREQLCRLLAHGCEPPKGDPCVPLAVILVSDKRIVEIEICRFRPMVYSNAVLLDLILCLWAKVDECCGEDHEPPPEPPPDTEPQTLRVKGVHFFSRSGQIASLDDTNDAPQLQADTRPTAIEVTFTAAVDQATVTAGGVGADMAGFSFLVRGGDFPTQGGFVPGAIQLAAPNVARFTVDPQFTTFTPGDYRVQLFGDADPPRGRPAIATPGGSRLNGEPRPDGTYPSGVGGEGGTFRFKFSVVS